MPNKTLVLKILVGLVSLVIGSYVNFDIPLSSMEIPISLQSLVVLLIAYFLGKSDGMIVILAYLILGAIGLPVFADGKSGVAVLTGNSAGYLFGFLMAVIILESFFENLKDNFVKICLYMALGTAVILLSGGIRLLLVYDLATTWQHGIKPFLLGGFIKVLLGAGVAFYLKSHRFRG